MSNKEFIQIPFNLNVNIEDIANIVHKAFEDGGSLHWCYGINTNNANDGRIMIHGMDGAIYKLTRDKLIIGIQQAIPYLDNAIERNTLNMGSIGIEEADLIVQLALFNELIYD
jgi:hypothetical protein